MTLMRPYLTFKEIHWLMKGRENLEIHEFSIADNIHIYHIKILIYNQILKSILQLCFDTTLVHPWNS